MAAEIGVHLQAKNREAIKLLLRLYDDHLILNDIGVRWQDKIETGQKRMVPNQDDMKHLAQAFGDIVQIFSQITRQGSVTDFAANFAGPTKTWAQNLIVELIDFNNGFAYLNQQSELSAAAQEKMNKWLDQLLTEIAATNKAFTKLTKQKS